MNEKDIGKVNIAVCDCTNGEVTLYWKVQLMLGTEKQWVAERHKLNNCSWATFTSVREVIL
tara:strand:- start:521 stop:703 length:183 start_codon:yes stop_codon:yes gene_type:complete